MVFLPVFPSQRARQRGLTRADSLKSCLDQRRHHRPDSFRRPSHDDVAGMQTAGGRPIPPWELHCGRCLLQSRPDSLNHGDRICRATRQRVALPIFEWDKRE